MIFKKNERIIWIFEHFMTKFHGRPEQPSYNTKFKSYDPWNYFLSRANNSGTIILGLSFLFRHIDLIRHTYV